MRATCPFCCRVAPAVARRFAPRLISPVVCDGVDVVVVERFVEGGVEGGDNGGAGGADGRSVRVVNPNSCSEALGRGRGEGGEGLGGLELVWGYKGWIKFGNI